MTTLLLRVFKDLIRAWHAGMNHYGRTGLRF